MRKILVLANQTLKGPELRDRLASMVQANPVRQVHIAVPLGAAGDTRADAARARLDLDQVIEELSDLNVPLSGTVVPADPITAAASAFESDSYDFILVSTLDARWSKWLSMDIPHRLARRFDVPVEHVESTATTPAPQSTDAPARTPTDAGAAALDPIRVLLVEDNDPDVVLTRKALDGCGVDYEMRRTREGASALEYFRTNGTSQTDLVLLDLRMPVMSGLELLEAAGAEFDLEQLNIVVLTTSSDPQDRSRAHQLGAAGYVIKDPDFFQFQQTLRSLLAEATLS